MKFLKNILFLIFFISINLLTVNGFNYNSELDKYIGKEEIIKNDFLPEISKSQYDEFKLLKKEYPENINIINIDISQNDFEGLFEHYYSAKRKINRESFPIKLTIIEDGNTKTKDTYSGKMKSKGNYSSQSLKIGLKINLDENIKSGFFKGKKNLAFRHLMYDVSGVNEKTFIDSFTKIHDELFGYEPYNSQSKYFFVFFNGYLYGYYLVMDEVSASYLKNVGEDRNKENDCIVKSKLWNYNIMGNLKLSTGKNRESIMGYDKMKDIYKIDYGEKKYCLGKFRELLTQIDNNNFNWVNDNFKNLESIYLWAIHMLKSNSFGGPYQNFVLVYHNNKWDITLWDGDLAFLPIDKLFTYDALSDNGLIELVIKNKNKLNKDIVDKIDNYDYKTYFKDELYNNYALNFPFILLDRQIWFKYIKKDIKYRKGLYNDYASGKMDEETFNEEILDDFWNIYYSKKFLEPENEKI